MTVSTFGFTAIGFAWMAEIGSLKEFSIKMKTFMGGAEKEKEYLNQPEDPELFQLENSLSNSLGGSSTQKQ